MIAQLPKIRMPEEMPKEKLSAEMKFHRHKVINIKLIELIKKPKIIKVFSANWGKELTYAIDSTGLVGHIKFAIAAMVINSKMISSTYTPQ